MSDKIRTSPDSISHGWKTVNNQTIAPSFFFPSASRAESDSDGPTVEHIEDIATYTSNVNDEKEHAVISGPFAENIVSGAITMTPAAAAAVASKSVTEDAEVENYCGDADAYGALHFWENEAASGFHGGGASGKRPGVSEGEYTQAGLLAEKAFENRLKRMQEMMGMYEARRSYSLPFFDEWKLIETGKGMYDPEQDKKEDEYWDNYMANSTVLEPGSPGVEDSGGPARRQQYVQARQNRLDSVRDSCASPGANSSASNPSLPMPFLTRTRRQSSTSVSTADITVPIPSPAPPMRGSPTHEASASTTGSTIPISSPVPLRHQSSTRDASPGNIGVGVSIPLPSPLSSPARTRTLNSEAYGKALTSFNALCQTFDQCVQLQGRENMNTASNEASSSNDVNVNININININGYLNGHLNGDTSTNVNGTETETKTDTDFPCDNTCNNEPDQEYDADGESSGPLALDVTIPRERANPSSPEPEDDSGYEEGN